MTVTVKIDNVPKITQSLKDLANTRVLVGIPEDSASRNDKMNNATLAYIHEFGSPAQNIPARPFLIPGIADSKDSWEPYLKQAANAAFQGETSTMTKALEAVGVKAVSAIKKRITSKIPPPLKPATVAARKRHKGPKGKKARAAYREFYSKYQTGQATMGDSSVTPLVDTAQMINSITYVVKTK